MAASAVVVSGDGRKLRLASFVLGSMLMMMEAQAADRCLSRSEARALWPRTHLYWNYSSGTRCWSSRRGGSRSSRQAVRVVRDGAPAPPPPSAPPETLAELMPPRWQDNHPPGQWAWIAQARAAAHDDDIPFSTFAPGAEPDVWPPLDDTSRGGIVIVVMSGLFAMALGLALWRWRLGRLRVA